MSRILLVEDNPVNRTLTRDLLSYRGHVVVEARDAEEGRRCLREAAPDLVLLDIQIPGGSGEELLREIRRDPGLRGLTVVALTAFAMRGDEQRFLAAGFDAYVSKPIDTRRFGPTIEELLERRRQAPS